MIRNFKCSDTREIERVATRKLAVLHSIRINEGPEDVEIVDYH